MIKITDNLLEEISARARTSERRRWNYNFHTSSKDLIQRFLNAVEPETYVRPHKHENPAKTEILIILKGRALILEFDDKGKVTDHVVLASTSGAKGAEITPRTWHSFMALQEGSVLYEMKEGPFIQETDKVFAKWSPEEGTQESNDFKEKIVRDLDIR